MRCKEVREIVEEARKGELSVPAREHLAQCSACRAYERDWRLVRAGFRALSEEQVPEASLGFATRLVRRLGEAADKGVSGAEFFEQVGRRVVYATLLVTMTMLLALVLPPSGPLRAPASAELYFGQAEIVTAENDPIFLDDLLDNPEVGPVNLTTEGERGEK